MARQHRPIRTGNRYGYRESAKRLFEPKDSLAVGPRDSRRGSPPKPEKLVLAIPIFENESPVVVPLPKCFAPKPVRNGSQALAIGVIATSP
jgi:hypothetical protein